MKNNKLNDYKKMDETALVKELKELKSELFKLRLSHAMNGLDNPNKIAEAKKNIARVNTILTIKKNGGEVVVKESKGTAKKAEKKTEKKAEKKETVKKTSTKTAKKAVESKE